MLSLKKKLNKNYSITNERVSTNNKGYIVNISFTNTNYEHLLPVFIDSINFICCGNRQYFYSIKKTFGLACANSIPVTKTSSKFQIFFCVNKIILFLMLDFLLRYKISFLIKSIFIVNNKLGLTSVFELSQINGQTLFLSNFKIRIFQLKRLYLIFSVLIFRVFSILKSICYYSRH